MMNEEFRKVFLLLVCRDDGVVVLNFDELTALINNGCASAEWISATRSRRQMYLVRGSQGQLDFKIGKDEFPQKIFA